MKEYIGVDIGGTKCAVVKADKSGVIIEKIRFDTTDVDGTLKNIIASVKSMASGKTAHIGISCGGPLDSKRGIILSPPNLPGWGSVEIVRILSSATGVPAALCNDANACALAEWMYGAGRGTKNMIFLTFGTGMGAGLILDGRLYEGTNGMAGEIGHVAMAKSGPVGYGKKGSFEGFCSGGGIARLGRAQAEKALALGVVPSYCKDMNEIEDVTAESIAKAAKNGDVTAIGVYKKSGEMLGRGLAILVDVLNPELIVIGSVFARSGELMIKSMERTLKREAIGMARQACHVVPAELGDNIGDVAAVSVARNADMSKHSNI